MSCDRTQTQVQWEAIVHVGKGGGIPHQGVALARQQQWNRDVSIVLAEFHSGSAVVEQATLMLSQTVESLREVRRKSIFDVQCFLSIQLDGFVSSRDRVSLPQKGLACQRAVLNVPPLQ